MATPIEPVLRDYLKERPTLKGKLSYFADEIPQEEAFPVAAYQTTEQNETRTLRGRTGLITSRIKFVIWSDRRGQAHELKEAIKDELDSRQGQPAAEILGTRSGLTVQACRVENEFNETEIAEEGSNRLTYATQFDVVIAYKVV